MCFGPHIFQLSEILFSFSDLAHFYILRSMMTVCSVQLLYTFLYFKRRVATLKAVFIIDNKYCL